MDRRLFIKCFGGMVALAGAGALAGISLTACTADELPSQLATQLHGLSDTRFEDYAVQKNKYELYHSLVDKGVISSGGRVNEENVASRAQQEPTVEYQNYYYAETELELYALAFLVNQKAVQEDAEATIVVFPGVDLMGSDLSSTKTPDGPEECATLCETDPDCSGFTYAKESHSDPAKRNSCWLKRTGFRYNKSDQYVSGIKR